LDHQRVFKGNQNDTNSSTLEMHKLTKQLEVMIDKIGDVSVHKPFRGRK
jgi:hypothetical protein